MKIQDIANDAFTASRKENTQEVHLFKGTMKPGGSCATDSKSICGKAEKTSSKPFECKNASEARIECAKLGRQVCGICVSNLYADFD